MKLLFAERMAGFDLLRAVHGLASRGTQRSADCDKALHRLLCYVNSTLKFRMPFFIGDDIESCRLWLLADSDHAAEPDNRNTSGGFLGAFLGNIYHPLGELCKKQASIAVSSKETTQRQL